MEITTLTGSNGTYKFNPEDYGNILGKGGMGIVYKGADQNNQPVAIKVMHRAVSAYVNNIVQAKREAAIQIKHKNLIRMLDFIEHDGDHHIVSEFIDGETLRNKLDKFPHGLNQQLSTDITTNILEGLETLHSYNVVHRDIDPSNIMICKDGTAKLMDFGIAKISGYDLQTLTGTGAFKGKYQYAAPEQIKGEKNKINNSTDIYAVGITFYEMLSGVLPFNGDSEFDLMKKHIEDPLPINNKIPNNLFGLITKATAKNQEERYKSASDFLEDLGHEKPLKTAEEYFERAEKYKESENWEKAIENYDIVIEKNTKFVNAHFWRAYCFAKLGKNNEAIVNYSFDIQNDPNESSGYHNRAISYNKIGKINEALADYKQAIKIDPEDKLYKNNYESFLESNNLHQQLIDDISEEIKQNPKNSELYLKRAFAELNLGNKEKYRRDLRISKGLGNIVASYVLTKIPIFKYIFKFILIIFWPVIISWYLLMFIGLYIFMTLLFDKHIILYPYGLIIMILYLIFFPFALFCMPFLIPIFERKLDKQKSFLISNIKNDKLNRIIQNYIRSVEKFYSRLELARYGFTSILLLQASLLLIFILVKTNLGNYFTSVVEHIKNIFN